MDIRLDPTDLAAHHIHLKPMVLKSLNGAGYHCLGDLRWVPSRILPRHRSGVSLPREACIRSH